MTHVDIISRSIDVLASSRRQDMDMISTQPKPRRLRLVAVVLMLALLPATAATQLHEADLIATKTYWFEAEEFYDYGSSLCPSYSRTDGSGGGYLLLSVSESELCRADYRIAFPDTGQFGIVNVYDSPEYYGKSVDILLYVNAVGVWKGTFTGSGSALWVHVAPSWFTGFGAGEHRVTLAEGSNVSLPALQVDFVTWDPGPLCTQDCTGGGGGEPDPHFPDISTAD